MGNIISRKVYDSTINFDDVKYAVDKSYTIVTTMPMSECKNMIHGTLVPSDEEAHINNLISDDKLHGNIIIYGKNSCDATTYQKYTDLKNFGFTHVFVYTGGMFEWTLLQDIYGTDEFPTTSFDLDILKFKSSNMLNRANLLT
jgi:hypothetical protein